MGNWAINIQGMGAHHNEDNEFDADKMTAKFVSELIAAGHLVENATFTFGGNENFLADSKEPNQEPVKSAA